MPPEDNVIDMEPLDQDPGTPAPEGDGKETLVIALTPSQVEGLNHFTRVIDLARRKLDEHALEANIAHHAQQDAQRAMSLIQDEIVKNAFPEQYDALTGAEAEAQAGYDRDQGVLVLRYLPSPDGAQDGPIPLPRRA